MAVRVASLACANPHHFSFAYQRLKCCLGGGSFYVLLLELVEQVARGKGVLHFCQQNLQFQYGFAEQEARLLLRKRCGVSKGPVAILLC